jgi:hypothetical protein
MVAHDVFLDEFKDNLGVEMPEYFKSVVFLTQTRILVEANFPYETHESSGTGECWYW